MKSRAEELFSWALELTRLSNLPNPLHYVYDISYTEDFNPNGRTKKFFETSILRVNLDEQLHRSVLKYNKMIAENAIKAAGLRDDHKEQEIVQPSTKKVHQCKHCFTIYDPEFGDLLNDIPAGVPFSKLHESYQCPTCEVNKKGFKVIDVKMEMFWFYHWDKEKH